jgi:shikimate dehydrogenase
MTAPYAEVIGDPIAHSKSPLIHRFWLDALKLPDDYRAVHVRPSELTGYFESRSKDPSWRGCNITVPHKEAALAHVTDPGGIRDSIGAINTVFRDQAGTVIGTNTDAAGFWSPISALDVAGKPVAVVGAGGAARAVLFALARMSVGQVTILNRTPLKAAGLLAAFGLKGEVLPLDARLPDVALLVNASTLGMTGQPPLDLDLSPLSDEAIVYDLVYAPLQTGLMQAAENRGLETVDGLDMLIGQAALAFELFFGAEPPRERDDELRELLTA